MRGDPQALVARLPRAAPSRRWRSWVADASLRRRQMRLQRLEVIERMAREQRHARQRGKYVPHSHARYRVRPW